MRAFAANVEEVFREAAARYTLVAYFALSSIFILVFAMAVELDVVNGALASAKLFGKSVEMHDTVSIEKLVLGFETGFAVFLYIVSTFLGVFATAHLVPRLQDKGTVDLWLSRPVGRVRLLLSRYAGGVLLSAANVLYLFGAIWLIVAWKTHVWNPRFLSAALLVLFGIAVLLAFTFLVGVATSSTAVSIMATFGVFFLSLFLFNHDKLAALVSAEWKAQTIHALYWVLPKSVETGKAVVALVSGPVLAAADKELAISVLPVFGSTALFGIASLALAALLFRRKDF